jgi:hypothetical protein
MSLAPCAKAKASYTKLPNSPDLPSLPYIKSLSKQPQQVVAVTPSLDHLPHLAEPRCVIQIKYTKVCIPNSLDLSEVSNANSLYLPLVKSRKPSVGKFKDSSSNETCINAASNCLYIKPIQYSSKPSISKSLPKLKVEAPRKRLQKKSIDLYSIEHIANQFASTPFCRLIDFAEIDDNFKSYSYMDKFDRSWQSNQEHFILTDGLCKGGVRL